MEPASVRLQRSTPADYEAIGLEVQGTGRLRSSSDVPVAKHQCTAMQSHSFRVDGLDLAARSSQTAILALEHPQYGAPIPTMGSREAGAAPGNAVTCREVMDLVEQARLLEQFDESAGGYEYNFLSTICDFVHHARRNVHMTALRAFLSFTPDSSHDIELTGGSSCLGKSKAIQEILKDSFGLTSHIVVEREYRTAAPNHAVLVLPCSDGVVFLDSTPALLVPLTPEQESVLPGRPITFPPDSSGIAHRGTLQTSFVLRRTKEDSQNAPALLLKRQMKIDDTGRIRKEMQTEYVLRCVAQPDRPVAKRNMLATRPYSIIARARDKEALLLIRVDFDRLCVVLESRMHDRHQSKKMTLPFSVFDQASQTIVLSLEPNQAKRRALEQDAQGFMGPSCSMDDFWSEFRRPEKVKEIVFTLTLPKSAEIMRALYREASVEDRRARVETELCPQALLPGRGDVSRTIFERMVELKVPGVSVVVIEDGRVAWSRGYGELERTACLVQAASISEIITSLVVLSLIEQCRLSKPSSPPLGLTRLIDLDTDVGTIFGGRPWGRINPKGYPVTIAQLLSHTAGMPNAESGYLCVQQIDRQLFKDVHELEQMFHLSARKPFVSVLSSLTELASTQRRPNIVQWQQDFLARLKVLSLTLFPEKAKAYNEIVERIALALQYRERASSTPLPSLNDILEGRDEQLGPFCIQSVPGTAWSYSNLGYSIVQKVIQVVTGKGFPEVVQERVLDPLEMGSTTYNPPLALTVRGNDGDGTPLPESWRITPHLAAEGLWTTAEDLARAIIAIQEARRNPRLSGRERPIIGPKLAAAMGSSQRGSLSWGLGLGIDGDSGYFFHEGKSAGFKNFVLFDMKGRGVVVLTNSDNGDVLYPEIVAAVAEAYAWPNRDRITAANTVSS